MRPDISDCRMFVRGWFHVKKFVMLPNGQFDGNPVDLFDTLWLDYEDLYKLECIRLAKEAVEAYEDKPSRPKRPKLLSEKSMEKAWKEFLRKEQADAVGKIITSLQYNASSDAELRKWLLAATGDVSELSVACIKHFVWQAKRKMISKEAVYHLVPHLWGQQGGGKTQAVKKLLEPVKGLVLHWKVNDSVDARNTQTLANNFVCLFDEMAGLERTELESLKHIITAEVVDYRPMRTNACVQVRQNCSFIGISNKSLGQNIYDPSGLRRFVDMPCLKKVDWELINAVKAIEIWRCVDENLERGYIEPFQNEMYRKQEEVQVIDDVTDFILQTNLQPTEGKDVRPVWVKELHDSYILWRNQNGYEMKTPLAINFFGAHLRTHRLEPSRKIIGGKDRIVYYVNSEADIFNPEYNVLSNVVRLR